MVVLSSRSLALDVASRTLQVKGGRRTPLPRRQFQILEALMRRSRATVGTNELLGMVWGRPDAAPAAALKTHVQVLHERGLSTDGEAPKLLTYDGVQQADVVVTMGCGETCPVFPGKTYEDWPLDDPKGQDLDTVRRIVDQVDSRVQDLLRRIAQGSSQQSRP